jgi:hypothetical protein
LGPAIYVASLGSLPFSDDGNGAIKISRSHPVLSPRSQVTDRAARNHFGYGTQKNYPWPFEFMAMTDIARTLRSATRFPVVAMYFLKCGVSRWAARAASLS